jgi:hypothetical protein
VHEQVHAPSEIVSVEVSVPVPVLPSLSEYVASQLSGDVVVAFSGTVICGWQSEPVKLHPWDS